MSLEISPKSGDTGAYSFLVDLLFRSGAIQRSLPEDRRISPSYELLDAIQLLKADVAILERRAVADYRDRGATWDAMAKQLGVSRQAVQKRFRSEPTD